MRTRTWVSVVIPLLIATLVAAGASDARAQDLYRVRGTLKSVTADQLVITSREGEVMGFQLSPDLGVFAVIPATIGDVKQGQFVGLTTVMAGDRQVALEAHLFADDLRGLGEGHYAWDLVKEPNMMTNASVAEIKDVGADRELKVSYQEGKPKVAGEQTSTCRPMCRSCTWPRPIAHCSRPARLRSCWSSRIATRPRSWWRSWSATRAPSRPCDRRRGRLFGKRAAPGGEDPAGPGLLRRSPRGRRSAAGGGSWAIPHPGGALRRADQPVR